MSLINKLKIYLTVMTITFATFTTLNTNVKAASKDGWIQHKGKWYYKDNNKIKKGWLKEKSKWYYLDGKNGEMKVGWLKEKGKWYYLDAENGDMKIGWLREKGKWYYLDGKNGKMKVGWLKEKGKWYYLDAENGDMKIGWLREKGKWYYLDTENGDMKISWLKLNNKKYYLDLKNGNMYQGIFKLNGKEYHTSENGDIIFEKVIENRLGKNTNIELEDDTILDEAEAERRREIRRKKEDETARNPQRIEIKPKLPKYVETKSIKELKDYVFSKVINESTKMPASNYLENDSRMIKEKNLVIGVGGEQKKLTLIEKSTGEKVDGVKWFYRTRYPEDNIFAEGEHVSEQKGFLEICEGGILKAIGENWQDEQKSEIWAYYKGELYKTIVTVKSKNLMNFDEEQRVLSKKADEIVKDMHNLSDLDKALASHDWLVNNVEYVERFGRDQSAYSSIVEGRTVCAGYAKGFKYLMDKLGVSSELRTGYVGSEMHLWNLLDIAGKWYNVDVTWDDTLKTQKNNTVVNHFLIRDKDFYGRKYMGSGLISDNPGEEYVLYGYQKRGILAKDESELEHIFKSQLEDALTKTSGLALFDVVIPETIDNAKIKSVLAKAIGRDDIKTYRAITIGKFKHIMMSIPIFRDYDSYVPEIESVKLDNTKKISSLEIVLKYEKDDLQRHNFRIKDVMIDTVTKKDSKTYVVKLKNPKYMENFKTSLYIIKKGKKSAEKELEIQVKKAEKPKVSFETIGENTVVLKNTNSRMKYRKGLDEWKSINSTEFTINNISLSNLIIREFDSEDKYASDVQRLDIKKHDEPKELKIIDGDMIGVDSSMEYKLSTENDWKPITSNKINKENLSKGKYQVRVKASGDYLASETVEIEKN
ncbi:transglutaminase domain-containing protein [Helcococcus ovis]|uniref:transglutaminase domain-containing protein n=1 Tax=Helcococcus ovis TaxID=72026 RepID=UPI0038BAAE6A